MVFEGCDSRRHTEEILHAAGFDQLDLRRRRLRRSLFVPVNSAIWGVATVGH